MSEATGRQKVVKSRSGCMQCKQKRMKCDETKPNCRNCILRNVECPGYARRLKWSTKYERFKPCEPRRPTLKPTAERRDANSAGRSTNGLQLSGDQSSGQVLGEIFTPVDVADILTATPVLYIDTSPVVEATAYRVDLGSPLFPAEDTRQGNQFSQDEDACYLWPEDEESMALNYDELIQSDDLLNVALLTDWSNSPALQVSSNSTPGDMQVQRLIPHYFSAICRMMSCFDSNSNPYRFDIPRALERAPYIYDCMLSLSAAHLSNFTSDMAITTLTCQNKAMNSLQEEMAKLLPAPAKPPDQLGRIVTSSSRYQVLLATILLGMTSAWYDPSAYALSHLKAARQLFKAWSNEHELVDALGKAKALDRAQSFIVGSMAYWEALASFLADQSLDTLDYLLPFCNTSEGQTVYPNPWTGIGTPVFIHLAQVGILLRQKRIPDKLALLRKGSQAKIQLESELLEEAHLVYDQALQYRLPPPHLMEETGDINTPVGHLCDVAKVYRYVALLELCLAFPLLSTNPYNSNTSEVNLHANKNRAVFDLATSALAIMCDLPQTSGTITVLSIALISAGSALQTTCSSTPVAVPWQSSSNSKVNLEENMENVRHSISAVDWWRDSVRQQIMHAPRQLQLIAIQRAARLVQEVWTCSDMHAAMSSNHDTGNAVHWIDVMIEQRLDTLYG